MSDQSNSPSRSTEDPVSEAPEPKLSIRDVAEDAYDEVIDASDEAPDTGQEGRTRDSLGRFLPKSDEQSKDPAPKPITEAQPKAPEPAPAPGSSTQVPDHWSAELKADFSKLPPEGQAILLNRHREMEADYTRKSQASAGAVSFAQALEPVFSDPVIQRSLQDAGMNVVQAIHEWGGFHRRAMSPEVKDRVELLVDLSQRMGLDPARLFAFAGNRPGPELSQEDLNDPAIQYFANKLGETTSDLQAVRAELGRMRDAEVAARQEWVKEGYLTQINAFGDEKDAQGNLAHPYLDAVMPQLHELYSINPARDLAEAYRLAVRMNDAVYAQVQEAERARQSGQNSAQRARQAMRGNTRGLTAPVAKPNSNANGSSGLRGVLESSADEVGL